MDIHRSSLRDFVMPRVRTVFVVDFYERIQSLLDNRKDFDYKGMLAKPRSRTQTEILWSSEAFDTPPRCFALLDGAEKVYYADLLSERLKAFQWLIASIKMEDGSKELIELLEKSLPYVDEQSVYCGNDEVVFVNWGLSPRSTGGGSSLGIYRKGEFLGNWKHKVENLKRVEELNVVSFVDGGTNDISEEFKVLTDESSDTKVNVGELQEEFCVLPPISLMDDNDDVLVPTDPDRHNSVENLNVEESDDNAKCESEISVATGEVDADDKIPLIQDVQEAKSDVDTLEKEVGRVKQQKSGISFFGKNWRCCRFIWSLLSGVLLLLLLFLLIPNRCMNMPRLSCSSLPDTSSIYPIDTACIGYGDDGLGKILLNRLNILLDASDEGAVKEFAEAFKKRYPSKDYYVNYYDNQTGRLQITVPTDERERLKINLPLELPNFDFIVYDEAIYEGGTSFNDPACRNSVYNWYLDVIQAYGAWEITTGSPDITVAIVDNGFDVRHSELAPNLKQSYNVPAKSSRVFPINHPEGAGHGTHVAATAVGACNNNVGLLGIAPHCSLMAVQVGDWGGMMTTTAIEDGVLYAIYQGADVINISLGRTPAPWLMSAPVGTQLTVIANTGLEEEKAWNHIFSIAQKHNCVIVFSAGNDNVVSGLDPKKRNPATIRVSAVNHQQCKADFSNYGNFPLIGQYFSTVSAPGVDIYSAVPNEGYAQYQGTSMAAPIVTGAVALMKSLDKSLTSEKIIEILQRTGKDVDGNIGKLIQIRDALLAVQGKRPTPSTKKRPLNCDSIAKRIHMLEKELERLKKLCPNAAVKDTLKFKDAVKDPSMMDGRWKTTAQLYSTSDETPLELYMEFDGSNGQLEIIKGGHKYNAPLTLEINGGDVVITQHAPAVSKSATGSFVPYIYTCRADKNGNFLCVAKSQQNGSSVEFNLIRVN